MSTSKHYSIPSLDIQAQYVWTDIQCTLPATIACNVVCHKESDEFIPCFSLNKADWNSGKSDALSWYASPQRDDFTFRTGMFKNFPEVQRFASPFKPTVGQRFSMTCEITTTQATYWLNGQKYATATYTNGTVPISGFFGFATYAQVEDISLNAITIFSEASYPPITPSDRVTLTANALGLLNEVGDLLNGGQSSLTKVTTAAAQQMMRDAVTAFASTSQLKTLSKDAVNAAIDRVYAKTRDDVSGYFDEQIAEESLMAISQAAMATGSIFTAFPVVAVIADATSLATLATTMGLEIDLAKKGPKIFAEANGMVNAVASQPELISAKGWFDARRSEILTIGQLQSGLRNQDIYDYFYAIIFSIATANPNLSTQQLGDKVIDVCKTFNNFLSSYPSTLNHIAQMISSDDPQIIEAARLQLKADPTAWSYIVPILSFIVVGTKVGISAITSIKGLRAAWKAVNAGEELPEGWISKYQRELTAGQKVSAGVVAVMGLAMSGFEIWQAVKTSDQKANILNQLRDARDSTQAFYDSIIDAAQVA
jgi:hypothetical protein